MIFFFEESNNELMIFLCVTLCLLSVTPCNKIVTQRTTEETQSCTEN